MVTIESMKSPVTFSVCEKCQSSYVPNAPPAEEFDELLRIESPEHLATFMPSMTSVTHLMNVDEVVGEYWFDTRVKCSFDGHRHQRGYLVRTRCGLVLQLGGTCANQTIANFRLVKQRLDDRREYLAFLNTEREESVRLRSQFGRIEQTSKNLCALWEAMKGVRELREEASLEFSLWRTGNADGVENVRTDLNQLLGWLDCWTGPPPLSAQRRYGKQRKAMQARVATLGEIVANPARLLSRLGMQRFIDALESEEQQVLVTRFDPMLGHEVNRYEFRAVRVRYRWDATSDGILDRSTGLVVRFAWPVIAASEAA